MIAKSVELTAERFIAHVISESPRLAVFDCDGTLWSGDAGKDFLYWEAQEGLLSQDVVDWALPRYAAYKQGKVDEATMCGEMATLHDGLSLSRMEAAAETFFTFQIEHRIFPAMRTLVDKLLR